MSIEEAIRKVIREELDSYFKQHKAPSDKKFEDAVKESSAKFASECIGEVEATPVAEYIERKEDVISNTAEMLKAVGDFCHGKDGMGRKAKTLLIELTNYNKFSEVPDDEASDIFNKVMETLA